MKHTPLHPRSTDARDYQNLPQQIGAMVKSFADGFEIAPHVHDRDQLLYAVRGVMRLQSERDALIVPLPRDPRLQRICAAVLADPADRRTVDAWSETAGASARTLARLFERDLGISFGDWRRRLRFHRAVEELSGGASIAQVSRSCGYRSPSAFSAAFRSFVGMPPSRLSASDDQARSPTTLPQPNRDEPAA